MELDQASCRILFVLCLTLFKLPDAVKGQCNTTALNICVQLLGPYAEDFVSFSVDSTNITEACNAYLSVQECVEKRSGCTDLDPTFNQRWAGEQHFYAYVCGAGREGYIKNQPCFVDRPLQSDLAGCLEAVNDTLTSGNQTNDQICKAYNDLFSCIETKASSDCYGPEAGKFLTRLLVEGYGPFIHFFYPCCVLNADEIQKVGAACITTTDASGLTTDSVMKQQCNTTALDICVQLLGPYAKDFVSFTVDSTNITDACNAYMAVQECVEQRTGCTDVDPTVNQRWTGEQHFYAHVCGQGRTDYLKHQPCFANKPLQQDMANCSAILFRTLINPTATSDQICTSYNDLFSCAENKAAEDCSSVEAGKFFTRLLLESQGPYIHFILPCCALIVEETQKIGPGCITTADGSGLMTTTGMKGQCNTTALNICLQLLGPYAEDFVSFTVDSTNITEACNAYQAAQQCVDQWTGCTELDPTFNQRWAGEQHFYAFVCGPGRTDYIKHQPCFESRVLQADMRSCLSIVNETQANPSATTDQLCKSYNDVFTCAEGKATADCSSVEAGKYLTKLLVESYGPYIHFFLPCCALFAEETQKIGPGCITTADGSGLMTTTGMKGQCNTTALNICVQLLGPYAEDFVSFTVDSTNITEACNAYQAAQQCVDQWTGCTELDPSFNQRWAGEQHFYAFVCGPARTDYIKHQPCFVSRVLQADMRSCLSIVNETQANPSATTDQLCKSYNEVFSCAESKAATDCSSVEAGKYLTKLLVESYGPYIHFFLPCCALFAEETQKIGPGCITTADSSGLMTTTGMTGQCNTTALNICVQLLGPYAEDFVSFTVDSSNITEACNAYQAAQQCVDQWTGCTELDPSFNQRWAGEQHFYAFVCGPGRTDYIKHQPCFVSRALQTDMATCLSIVNETQANPSATTDQLCKSYNDVLTCAESKAAADCSSVEAGKYLTKLFVESYGPYVHFFLPCCILFAEDTQKIGPGCVTTEASGLLTGTTQGGGKTVAMVKIVMPPVAIFFALSAVVAAMAVTF